MNLPMSSHSEEEIQEMISKANENDGKYSGMTYEQGVEAALCWAFSDALGYDDEPPID